MGIIKPGARVVSAAEHLIARVVIRRRCAEQSAFLAEIENAYYLEDVLAYEGCFSFTAISYDTGVRIPIALRLAGRFQVRNALTALAAARLLAERARPSTTNPSRAASPRRHGPAGSKRSASARKFTSTARTIPPERAKSPSSGNNSCSAEIFI